MAQATEKVAGYEGDTENLDWPALWEALQPWIEHGEAVAGGAELDAPDAPVPPTIRYLAKYEPQPLPLESGGGAAQ